MFRVKASEDVVEILNTRETGEVNFIKPESLPSDFIPYDTSAKTPDAATVLGWVKTKLGSSVVDQLETDAANVNDVPPPEPFI